MKGFSPLAGLWFTLAATLFWGVGCAGWKSSKPQAQAVNFGHPDEIIRGRGFFVLADRREFVVMSFMNAMGYDTEAGGQSMHPVRVKVREMLAVRLANHPRKAENWRRYYEGRQVASFQYQDFALSLSADYPFRRIRPTQELGYPHTAEMLKDFPDVLNDFWETVGLEEVWGEVKGDYLAELRKYDLAKMERQMAFLWEYLRMERQDAFTLVNVPNLMEHYFHAIGAQYEHYYYTVESPGANAYSLNIHEYLHSVVNPLVKAAAGGYMDRLLPYYRKGEGQPMSASYREPVLFAYECLVRALDHRLRVLQTDDAAETKRAEDRVAQLTREGLTLTGPFCRQLPDYERSGKSFEEYLPTLLQSLPALTD